MTKIERARQLLKEAERRRAVALDREKWQSEAGWKADAENSRQEAGEAAMECDMYRDIIAVYERAKK